MRLIIDNQEFSHEEIVKKWQEVKNQLSESSKKMNEEDFNKMTLKQTKNKLIQDTLLLQEAQKKYPVIEYGEIKEKYEDMKKHFSQEKKIPEEMKEENEFQIKENIENYLRVNKLIASWFTKDLSASPKEVQDFFKQNRHTFDFSNFSLFTRIKAKEDQQKSMEFLLSFIEKEGFKALTFARDNKNIFTVIENALIQRGALLLDVEGIIFDLKENEFSRIIQTQHELNIFIKKKDFVGNEEVNFSIVQDLVKTIYLKRKKEKIVNQKIQEFIEKANINFLDN